MPASATTMSLPLPSTNAGTPASRASRSMASTSSSTVAGVGQAVGAAPDPQRRQRRQRHVRPQLHAALGGERVEALDRIGARRALIVDVSDGSGRCSASASSSAASALGGVAAGRGVARPRPSRRAWRRRAVRDDLGDQPLRVEVLVGDDHRGARVAEVARVVALVGARVRIRHEDRGHADRGHLGAGRRAGAPDDEVGGHERIGHAVGQEGLCGVALDRSSTGRCCARGAGIGHARLAGEVQHVPVGQQPRERGGDGAVQSGHRLRPAEDEEEPVIGPEAERAARGLAVDAARTSGSACPDTKPLPGNAARVGGKLTATRVA